MRIADFHLSTHSFTTYPAGNHLKEHNHSSLSGNYDLGDPNPQLAQILLWSKIKEKLQYTEIYQLSMLGLGSNTTLRK